MKPVSVIYTNHRGERAVRRIVPELIRFGTTEWHPEPQWLLECHDAEKDAHRTFALAGVEKWSA